MGKSLERLFADLNADIEEGREALPPVDQWDPPLSGDIDIRIAVNGQWFHEGDAIQRDSLVRLFSTVLKREGDEYFLVTPVEKWRIQVDDVPFSVVKVETVTREGEQALLFETATGDRVLAGPDHPLRVSHDPDSGEPSPYLLVRDGMEGRLVRSVFYELVEMAQPGPGEESALRGVYSMGEFFPLE